MYVYFIAGHDEGGSESPRATMDRGKLPALIERCIEDMRNDWNLRQRSLGWDKPFPEAVAIECRQGLSKALKLSDEELSKRSTGEGLQYGWGGLHLYVVKIEENL